MDFEELKNESHQGNMKKNRTTLLILFTIFLLPVVFAYGAYFTGWFSNATKNMGTLLVDNDVLDIEDFLFTKPDGVAITGKELETLYWWLMPIDPAQCDQTCLNLNTYMLNQTYLGLGKEAKRINQLLILPTASELNAGEFPFAHSEFSNIGVKAIEKTHSGLDKDLPANFIYLVDPLGNIILRYPLVSHKDQAAKNSKDLRTDLLLLFKYSRLG